MGRNRVSGRKGPKCLENVQLQHSREIVLAIACGAKVLLALIPNGSNAIICGRRL